MKIDTETRVRFLEAYNKLNDALNTINDCSDLYMSDIRALDDLRSLIAGAMELEPIRNDEGHYTCYSNWKLKE